MKNISLPCSLLSLFLLLSTGIFSQINSYDRYWYFGPYNAWDWSSGSPVPLPGCIMNNVEGSQTTNDGGGNMLFYGGDDKIYNANNVLMPNSVGLHCTTTPKQGPICVQSPANPNRYYYIYPGGAGSPLKYSMIDMTMQTGLGDVDNAFKNITLRAVVAEGCLAIPRTNTCNEFWVLSHGLSNDFYMELISPTGIANFSTTLIGPTSTSMGGYMDFNPLTGKLAFLYGNFNVGLCDFNAATGLISNFVNVPLPSIPFCLEYYSLAFSSNGTKLYVGGGYGQNHLVQVDLANSNFVTTIATGNGGNTLKLGPDGKIYGQILYTSQVGIVNNPNAAGLACNYVPNAINTGNVTYSDIGFPSMGIPSGVPVVAGVTALPTTVCAGDSAVLTATGGSTYSWSTSATTNPITVFPTATTTYTVIAMNGACTDTATITITLTNSTTASITGNAVICSGSTTTLTGNGGGNYSWNTGATTSIISVSPTTSTTYTLYVSNGSCSDSATQTVTVNPAPNGSITGTNIICQNSPTTLTGNGGGTYSWNTGSTSSAITVTPTSTTTYTLYISNGNCTDTVMQTVTVNPAPTGSVSGTTSICSGSQTTLTASGGNTYSWNTSATITAINVSPTITTTYTVTVTGANGCTDTTTVTVIVNNIPVASITGNLNICAGQSTTLTAGTGTTYSWNTGSTNTSISVSPTTTTYYTVVVSNGNCSSTATVTVNVTASPTANAGVSVSITIGAQATLNANGGGTYLWSTGETTQTVSVSPTITTTYCVQVTNTNNCTDTACVTVYVDVPCNIDLEKLLPNAFAPNGSLINSKYCVPLNYCFQSFILKVYDRWGEKVFETSDANKCWDGTYKGVALNTDVFAFYFDAILVNGEAISQKGNISLIQ